MKVPQLAQELETKWRNPVIERRKTDCELRKIAKRERGAAKRRERDEKESDFSRQHSKHSDSNLCWLCLLPFRKYHPALGKTWDHVIPRSQGGSSHKANLRPAHRHCNNRRRNLTPTPELVLKLRQHMQNNHADWFLLEGGFSQRTLFAPLWFEKEIL